MKNTSYKILIIGLLAIAGLSFAASDRYFRISQSLDVMSALYREVNVSYVDETDPSKMMRNLIDGMLKTLDPYTNYFSQSQVETARMQQTGKFGGVGINVEIMDGLPVVNEVIKGLPADENGLNIGDKILEIDGASTQGKKIDDVEKFLRGQPGSTLALKVLHLLPGGTSEQKYFSLPRVETQETNVPYFGMITDNIGVIRLKIFNENAGKDVKHAFDSLKRANAGLKGLILDLRGNPGGLLVEAVNIVNVFVDKNQLVVSTKGKVDEWNTSFRTLNEPSDTKIPVAAVTDNMSASASEIVSGSLQDLDRGIVVGQRTYGKGLVQITKNLSYNTVLKVTTAKYYIPSGRCIQAINYAEKNQDGSVKKIPDSLKTVFKTKAGRKVFDGGGVDPDLELPKPELSRIAEKLTSTHLIFDFATQYKFKNPSIAAPDKFKLTASDFNDFLAFIKDKDYAYNTESEKLLQQLKETAEEEKYFDAVQQQYESIKLKLAHDKQQDVAKQKDEIVKLLESEIVGRYYYISGKEQKQMLADARIAKAIEVLSNNAKYTEILSVKK